MKKYTYAIFCLLILFLLGGCSKSQDFNVSNFNHEQFVKYFSSDVFKGRLTGTQGNRGAESLLNKIFKEMELGEVEGFGYLHPYDHVLYHPEKQKVVLEIKQKDGKIQKCTYGEDFLPQILVHDLKVELQVTKDIDDHKLENKAVILQSHSMLGQVYGKSKAVLVNTDVFKQYINVQEEGFPVIQISHEVFKQLYGNSGTTIYIEYDLNKEVIEAHNIVGRIPGEDRKSAIILSAHFDHVGCVGNKIFYGAIDNSSGVSVVLDVAKRLKEYSKDNLLDCDVLICLFNGEESGLQGSKAFARYIKGKYRRICNINVDTVGISEDKNLLLVQGDSREKDEFAQGISDFFNSKGFSAQIENGVSDHVAFLEEDIPAVNLGQKSAAIIHTTQDKPGIIDYQYLEKLSQALYHLIIDKGSNLHMFSESVEIKDMEEKISGISEELVKKARDELKFGQYKIVETNEKMKHLIKQDTLEFSSQDEVVKIYPEVNIPSKIGNYILTGGCIKQSFNHGSIADMEPGRIYKISPQIEDVDYLRLEYKNTAQSEKFTIVIENTEQVRTDQTEGFKAAVMRIDDRDYEVISGEDGNIISLKTTIKRYDKTYQVVLTIGKEAEVEINGTKVKGIRPDWFGNSKDEIANFIKNSGINSLIENIFMG